MIRFSEIDTVDDELGVSVSQVSQPWNKVGTKARLKISKNLASLTKAELADLLFEKVGLNKREAKDMVESFFEEICSSLVRGEEVKLTGFGGFQLRDKAPRPGRNPRTGEATPIAARRVVTFHSSQKLKSLISNPEEDDNLDTRFGFGVR